MVTGEVIASSKRRMVTGKDVLPVPASNEESITAAAISGEKVRERIVKDFAQNDAEVAGKAAAVLKHIWSYIKLSEDDRVIYPDGRLGSHVGALLGYFIIGGNEGDDPPKPIDADQFSKLLKIAKVKACDVGRKDSEECKIEWLNLY